MASHEGYVFVWSVVGSVLGALVAAFVWLGHDMDPLSGLLVCPADQKDMYSRTGAPIMVFVGQLVGAVLFGSVSALVLKD